MLQTNQPQMYRCNICNKEFVTRNSNKIDITLVDYFVQSLSDHLGFAHGLYRASPQEVWRDFTLV
jgi:hypothetical protein